MFLLSIIKQVNMYYWMVALVFLHTCCIAWIAALNIDIFKQIEFHCIGESFFQFNYSICLQAMYVYVHFQHMLNYCANTIFVVRFSNFCLWLQYNFYWKYPSSIPLMWHQHCFTVPLSFNSINFSCISTWANWHHWYPLYLFCTNSTLK